MRGSLRVLAPMAGSVRGLRSVPDPVFAAGIAGPGLAIEPQDGNVSAPICGVVVVARPHAVVLRSEGRDVLVHIGLNTVGLHGVGFELLVTPGRPVAAGAPMVRWDPGRVADAGLSAWCPLIAVQAPPGDIHLLVVEGDRVEPGIPILDWI